MALRKFLDFFRICAVVLVVSGVVCPTVRAQSLVAEGRLPEAPAPLVEAAQPVVLTSPNLSPEHKFWDTQNRLLFVAAAALNGADFEVTRANLQSGGQELNPLVRPFGRSTAGLAMNFAGETVGVIGLSYFLHKTGHHKLERAVSLVNIGTSASAVSFGLAHR
jgi:hypothetical protein